MFPCGGLNVCDLMCTEVLFPVTENPDVSGKKRGREDARKAPANEPVVVPSVDLSKNQEPVVVPNVDLSKNQEPNVELPKNQEPNVELPKNQEPCQYFLPTALISESPVTPKNPKYGPVSDVRAELRNTWAPFRFKTFSPKKLLSKDAPILDHVWIVGKLSIRHNARFAVSKLFPEPIALSDALAVLQDMTGQSHSIHKNPKITGNVKVCELARINNTKLDVAVQEAVSRYANEFPPLGYIYIFTLPDELDDAVNLGRFS